MKICDRLCTGPLPATGSAAEQRWLKFTTILVLSWRVRWLDAYIRDIHCGVSFLPQAKNWQLHIKFIRLVEPSVAAESKFMAWFFFEKNVNSVKKDTLEVATNCSWTSCKAKFHGNNNTPFLKNEATRVRCLRFPLWKLEVILFELFILTHMQKN